MEKKKNNQKKIVYLQLVLIFLGALILRFSPMLWNRDFWYDEAFTGILLKNSWGEMNRMIFADVHPPLYYWLAKPLSSLFDYSPFGIRLFSVIFSLASLISIFWIGKKIFSLRAGLLAAIFFAFSPFVIEYAQEARMYALFGFLMLWAVWFFYQALEKNRRRDWLLWGIFSGLSFLTHYLSLFFFVLFYLVFLGWRIFFNQKKWYKVILGEKGFWQGAMVIGVFFLSWLKIFISHISKGNLGWIDVTYFSVLPSTIQIFLFGHPPGAGGVPSANVFRGLFDSTSIGLIVLFFGAILASWLWSKKQKRQEIFLLTGMSLGVLIFLIFLSHLNIKLYVSRYFMPAALLIYLLLAGMLTEFFSGKMTYLKVALIFAIFLFWLKPINYASDWNQIALLKKAGLLQNEVFVTTNPFDYSTARYYFGENNVRYYNKNNPNEDFSGWVVVGNKNRIEELSKIRQLKNFVIVDNSCDWKEMNINLEEVFQTEKLKVCQPSENGELKGG